MRIIGSVENEKQAFVFYSFLSQVGVHSTYEPYTDPETKKEEIRIWVYEEDAVEQAIQWLAEYKSNPQDPKFASIPLPFTPPQPPDLIAERKREEQPGTWKNPVRMKKATQSAMAQTPLTFFIVFLCSLLFIMNSFQEIQIKDQEGPVAVELMMTPLDQALLFDYPAANQAIDKLFQENPQKSAESLGALPVDFAAQLQQIKEMPTWSGAVGLLLKKMKGNPIDADLQAPLFTKIREGEFWRLFTPSLMHGGILHILFNMAWAWLLLKAIEGRLKRWKLALIVLIIGVVSNVAQYLMSGPLFLGFSGVVVGLVGFIWMRQRVAPWEGYPLHRSTIVFVLIFVLGMLVIDLIAFAVVGFGLTENTIQIANTGHIVGGLTGILLGRIPLFSRGMA